MKTGYTNTAQLTVKHSGVAESDNPFGMLQELAEIKFIDDVLGIHNLHNPKKELLCYLRMENKEASMQELAEMISEELGTVIT